MRTEWIGLESHLKYNQPNANDGASVLLKSLKIIYNHTHKLSGEGGFEDSLREFVAKKSPIKFSGNNLLEVPITTYGDSGGRLLLSNLTVITEPGYYSSLNWNSINHLDYIPTVKFMKLLQHMRLLNQQGQHCPWVG